jgi:hypothetical protein
MASPTLEDMAHPHAATPFFQCPRDPRNAGGAWWRSLSPVRQDRFAALAPLAAVLLFMAAIVAAFWYLRVEEGEREQEALRRDVEYAQQRVRLRLLERQEQLMRIARDLSNQDMERTQL